MMCVILISFALLAKAKLDAVRYRRLKGVESTPRGYGECNEGGGGDDGDDGDDGSVVV